MMAWERRARLALLGVCMLATVGMVGCGAMAHVATVPGKDEVAADQGVLMLSVTSNSPRSGQFDSIVLEKEVPKGDRAQTYQLNQISRGLARDTALFVGAVPAGRYKVVRFNVGTLFINVNEATQARIGTAVVQSGKTRDLGRLVVTNLNDKVLIGRSELVKSNVDLVQRFAPEAASHVAQVDGSGWAQPRDSADHVEEFALGMPAGADALTELPGGEVVAASRMGSILLRTTDGKWRRMGTGGLESLLWLKAGDDPGTRLVAVGEFDTIVRVGADWKPQRLSPGNLPAGNLVYVDGNAKAGWYVILSVGKKATLLHADALDAGDWKPVRDIDAAFSFWSGGSRFWAWPTPEGLAYAVSEGQINWLNFSTGQWTQTRAPEGRRITSIQPGPGGALGLLSSPGGGLGGVFAGIHMSLDRGATWQTLESPVKVNAKPPVRLASGSLVLQGSQFSSKELYHWDPATSAWSKLPGDVYLSEALVAMPTKGMFAIDDGHTPSGYASIRHSMDEGRTWWVEYSNYIDLSKSK